MLDALSAPVQGRSDEVDPTAGILFILDDIHSNLHTARDAVGPRKILFVQGQASMEEALPSSFTFYEFRN
jgi:hypothetical protein